MAGEIKLTPKALFGYVLFILGLMLLGYVCLNAIYLASGVFQPLKIELSQVGQTFGIESQVFFGIVVQIGMYALIVAIASVFMKYGLNIARNK